MRKYYFIKIVCLSLLLLGCGGTPEGILSPEKMTAVLYDTSILYQLKNNQPDVIRKDSLDLKCFIFEKYGIDSLAFRNSINYYTHNDRKKLRRIYKQVVIKIGAKQKEIEQKDKEIIQQIEQDKKEMNKRDRKKTETDKITGDRTPF